MEIVDKDHLDVVVLLKTAALGSEFVDGKLGGVVDEDFGVVEDLGACFELLAFPGLQFAFFEFVAGDLSLTRDESHGQLDTCHFEREEGHRFLVVDGHIAGD